MTKPRDPTRKAKDGSRRGRPARPGHKKPDKRTAMTDPKKGLTPLQEAFIHCWMVRRNNTQAYLDSHPNCLSVEAARVSGSRLFRDIRIAAQIKALLADEAKAYKVDARRITATLAALAFTPLSAAFTKSGTVHNPADMPEPLALAVQKLKRREMVGPPNADGEREIIGHTIEFAMHDRTPALRLLGLELGMFVEKHEHTADDAIIKALREGRERALAGGS